MNRPIDINRCRSAMRRISVSGLVCNAERECALSDAIAAIQRDPANALLNEYIGVKHYAGFDDQRSDHPYGMCPRHGDIVFRIDRLDIRRDGRPIDPLGPDEIYLLECVRDAGEFEVENRDRTSRERMCKVNLCEAIRRGDTLAAALTAIHDQIKTRTVESHLPVPAGVSA